MDVPHDRMYVRWEGNMGTYSQTKKSAWYVLRRMPWYQVFFFLLKKFNFLCIFRICLEIFYTKMLLTISFVVAPLLSS